VRKVINLLPYVSKTGAGADAGSDDINLVHIQEPRIKVPQTIANALSRLCLTHKIDTVTAMDQAVRAFPGCDPALALSMHIMSYLHDQVKDVLDMRRTKRYSGSRY